MSRYIDADKAKEKKVYSEDRHEYVVPVAELDWLPTADVQEVMHGHWIEKALDNFRKVECSCSICGWSGVENYERVQFQIPIHAVSTLSLAISSSMTNAPMTGTNTMYR